VEKKYVRDVMHIGVISCRVETSVSEAMHLMQTNRIHALVVVDGGGWMAGIVSQTDLLKAWETGSSYEEVMQGAVGNVMTTSVITCMPNMELNRAIRLLNRHRIHRLVVVEERNDGRFWPIGILSLTDLVLAMEADGELRDAVQQDQTPSPS
jgi:CBS-domain-containing membrane protein